MDRHEAERLLELVRRFLDGTRTMAIAFEIEGLVIKGFQEESWFEEASECLALFVPGESAPYIDESGLALALAQVEAELVAALRSGE